MFTIVSGVGSLDVLRYLDRFVAKAQQRSTDEALKAITITLPSRKCELVDSIVNIL